MLKGHYFAHALKLFACGSKQYVDTDIVIKPRADDQSLTDHLEHGLFCDVLRREAWTEDYEGVLLRNKLHLCVHVRSCIRQHECTRV